MPATTYLDRFPAIKEPAGPRSKAALAVYQAGASSVLRAVNSLKMIVARQTGADEAVDSSGPDCVAFEEQSVGEDAGTAATTGDDDVCFTNDTDSDDSCNDAEASDGNPLPRPDDDFSRNGVIGSEEGNEPNPEDKAADDEGPPTRKFRWSVTIEEEQKVRERVWKKMEQELEESSRDDSWDSSKEHMQDMVTRRKEIQEMKRLEEIRRERLRKMRSVRHGERFPCFRVYFQESEEPMQFLRISIVALLARAGESPHGCDHGGRRLAHLRAGELGEEHRRLRQGDTKVRDKSDQ